jgi:hypothetical protein
MRKARRCELMARSNIELGHNVLIGCHWIVQGYHSLTQDSAQSDSGETESQCKATKRQRPVATVTSNRLKSLVPSRGLHRHAPWSLPVSQTFQQENDDGPFLEPDAEVALELRP